MWTQHFQLTCKGVQHKVILGTVQLGIPYGINNSMGKPSENEAFRILELAYSKGLRLLDSADAYGDALSVIGKFHRSTGKYFNLINKFKIDHLSVTDKLRNCLDLTGLSSLYSYMYHDFADYKSGQAIDELVDLKNSHLIQKIGVSLYSLEQLRIVVEDSLIDLIQLPANLFDLRTDKLELLRSAHDAGKEIHARSVFLQGLFLRDPEMLTGNLVSFHPYLKQLRILSNELNMDLKQYALNFVLHQPYIDCILLGVEQAEQLQENIALIIDSFDLSKCPKIEIQEQDMYLLNPSNWQQ